MGRSLCALGTLLALAGVAGAHSARGATWGGERPAVQLRAAHPLLFVSAARQCAGPLVSSAAVCRYPGARPAVPQLVTALPGVIPAVRARDTLRPLSLSAVGAGGKYEDDWNSYAMLEDSDSEESLDEQAKVPEAPSAPASAVVSSAPALEDDPRAVHMPAVEDDTSILQGSAFGQVCWPPRSRRFPTNSSLIAHPAEYMTRSFSLCVCARAPTTIKHRWAYRLSCAVRLQP